MTADWRNTNDLSALEAAIKAQKAKLTRTMPKGTKTYNKIPVEEMQGNVIDLSVDAQATYGEMHGLLDELNKVQMEGEQVWTELKAMMKRRSEMIAVIIDEYTEYEDAGHY